ncbi:MAG: sigma-70 family RNA polymerase sigma factor [Actinomycetota bacterium]|nr:sigma-70 family RNA polymerase sigma factor [Actinomycetota bacterium]
MTPDDLVAEIPSLYAFARALVRDEHLAADLTQDTLIRAIERSHQHRNDAPLGAWLKRILRNLATDRARRSDREVVVDDVDAQWHDDEYTVDPANVVDRASTRDELEDALARLPFILRSTVLLHDVEGWTVQQIADVDQIGLPAAKQRLRRGRMALVSALAAGDERRHLLKGVPMRCWDARQHISDYLDGTLDGGTARTVEAHLQTCPTCPPLYAALVGVHGAVGELRDTDAVVSPSLAERLTALVTAALRSDEHERSS